MSTNENQQPNLDLETLKKPIQDIIRFTDGIDERYREKCFELLLHFYLSKGTEPSIGTVSPSPQPQQPASPKEVILPIDVRAFLQQNGIPDEKMSKLFLVDKEEIRPTYKITTTKKSIAQIQIALLAALENAMSKQGNKFEFSKEMYGPDAKSTEFMTSRILARAHPDTNHEQFLSNLEILCLLHFLYLHAKNSLSTPKQAR